MAFRERLALNLIENFLMSIACSDLRCSYDTTHNLSAVCRLTTFDANVQNAENLLLLASILRYDYFCLTKAQISVTRQRQLMHDVTDSFNLM